MLETGKDMDPSTPWALSLVDLAPPEAAVEIQMEHNGHIILIQLPFNDNK